MNRKGTFRFAAVVLLGVLMASAAVAAPAFQLKFNANLTAAQEVGVVSSSTSGDVQLSFNAGLSNVRVVLSVFQGVSITAAHIHCAAAGVNGPIVVTLFAGPTQDVNGVLVNATFVNPDVTPTICGPHDTEINNIASLLAALREGILYVNVHSIANPAGVVRGQLFSGVESLLAGPVGK